MHVFVDRQQEMETLQSEYARNGSALVVLYGAGEWERLR